MMHFEISKGSPLPLHTQLLDDLRHKVLTGVFQAHDQLPGEWELAKELDISRTTIQKAWQSAEEEKLIYRVPGKGTFIAPPVQASATVRQTIGLVIPDFRSIFAAQLVGGAERILRAKGCRVQVASSEYTVEEEDRVLHQMNEDGVRGYIIRPVQSSRDDRLITRIASATPTVLLDRPVPTLHVPCITSHNYAGAMEAMQHLLSLGHRHITFVARPHLTLWTVAERYRAYGDAMRDAGHTPLPTILIGSDEELNTYNAYAHDDDNSLAPLVARLQAPDRPTAIFAVNDWMAIRTLRAATAAGLRVPEDLSLVGFDDLEVSRALVPPLTTVAQNGDLLGAEAAYRLLNLLDGVPSYEVLTLLPTRLIVRGSTAPA